MGFTAYTEPHCLYSTANPLLSLWPVLHQEGLCACTVHLNLNSEYERYGLYRASFIVQCFYKYIPPMERETVENFNAC